MPGSGFTPDWVTAMLLICWLGSAESNWRYLMESKLS